MSKSESSSTEEKMKGAAEKMKGAAEKTRADAMRAFDETFDSIDRAAKAGAEMQREFFNSWSGFWQDQNRGIPWADGIRSVQGRWADAISDAMEKRREVLEIQYRSAVETMESGRSFAQSSQPDEFAERGEEYCRVSLDAFRKSSEAQIDEFQCAARAWMGIGNIVARQAESKK